MKKELYIMTIEPSIDIIIVLPDEPDLSIIFNAKMLLSKILGAETEEWHEERFCKDYSKRKEAKKFKEKIGINGTALVATIKAKNKGRFLREIEEYFSLNEE